MRRPGPAAAGMMAGLLAAAALAAEEPLVRRGTFRMPEVSGAAALPGGRLLLVSDEVNEAAVLVDAPSRLAAGEVTLRAGESLAGALEDRKPPVELEDLEDAAWDGADAVYAVTSHSRTRRGETPDRRYRLARFRFDAGGRLAEARATDALLQAVVNGVPFLGDALRRPPARSGFNIEGLAFTGERHLLVGLRAPTVTESAPRPHGGQEDAVVLRVRNPEALFAEGAPPADLGDVVKVDLRGQGIRGMAWDPGRRAVWILSGLSTDPGYEFASPWGLWLWDEKTDPRPVQLPEGLGLANPEAVTLLPGPAGPRLLLVEDGRPASPFALFAPPAP